MSASQPSPSGSLREVLRHPVVDRVVGGWRGLVDGGLPPLLFLASYRVIARVRPDLDALPVALAISSLAVLAVGVTRWRRGEPLRQAAFGFAGVLVAAASAAALGEARAFFLPGLLVDVAYAGALAGSIACGLPVVGVVHTRLARLGPHWRKDRAMRRRYAVATALWALAYALRASVQAVFYAADRPDALAAAKLLLGWPLSVACLVVTVRLLRGVVPAAAARAV